MHSCPKYFQALIIHVEVVNPFEHTACCEMVETSMSFACNSSFLSVDGMTCPIPFQSLRNDLSNGISYVEIVSIFRL